MEELVLTLRCETCDNPDCKNARHFIPSDSLEGCTRRVPELIHDQYLHYMEEVIPFWITQQNQEKIQESYKEVIDFLMNNIYTAPIGQKLDKRGKGNV